MIISEFTVTVIILKGTFNVIEYTQHPYKLWWGNYRERRQFDDLGVEGRVILRIVSVSLKLLTDFDRLGLIPN